MSTDQQFSSSITKSLPMAAMQEAKVRQAMNLVGAMMYAKLAPSSAANMASVAMQRQIESTSKAVHNYAFETACGATPGHTARNMKRHVRLLRQKFVRCGDKLPNAMHNRCESMIAEVEAFAKMA